MVRTKGRPTLSRAGREDGAAQRTDAPGGGMRVGGGLFPLSTCSFERAFRDAHF